MKAVHQTIFGSTEGNCFAACIASVLEIPLDDVPNFCAATGEHWMGPFQRWLGERGLFAFEVMRYADHKFRLSTLPAGVPVIVCGKSPRGDYLHSAVAVVDDNGQVILTHDPHPDGTFFDGPIAGFMVLAATNPASLCDARRSEREACAKVAEGVTWQRDWEATPAHLYVKNRIAAGIRSMPLPETTKA